tara:strand:- start:54863 stop:55051 length:189 start_codon:yes stop_codon:yes gene_type:complete
MNFLKLLLALTLIAQVNFASAQDDMSEESWGEETTMPVATPIVNEDAAGEEEMPVYDEGSDY